MSTSEQSGHHEPRIAIGVLWALFIGLDSAAQLLFKSAALGLPEPSASLEWVRLVVTSLRVWLALACIAVVFAVWMMILRRSPLAIAFPATASTYIFVVTASRLVLGETITPLQYAGIALIIGGVALLRPAR